MQDSLFDNDGEAAEVDADHDPYAEVDEAGRRLAKDYGINPDQASDMVLAFGSEVAARKVLDRRWWMRPEQKAA